MMIFMYVIGHSVLLTVVQVAFVYYLSHSAKFTLKVDG